MKEETREWIKKAESDLKAAIILFEKGIFEYSIFHSQQAIEKFLKSFLVEKDMFNPNIHKTHDLLFLLEECKKYDNQFKNLEKLNIKMVNDLGIPIRYPYPLEVTEEEAKEAIEIAEKVKEFVLKKLKL